MSRLNEVFADPQNTDNTVLIRVLNTFLGPGDDNSMHVFRSILYFTPLLKKLCEDTNRPEVKFAVDLVDTCERANTFEAFKETLEQVIDADPNEYKTLFVMSYCRSKWELQYNNCIAYKKPSYAIEELTETGWFVFLKAFKNNDYVFI